jgi:hypothetical protein
MYTVSVIKNFKKIIENVSIFEIFQRIRMGGYATFVKPLRRLYNEGNLEAYNRAKSMLLAFTPAGKFLGERKGENIADYSHFIVLDYDKLNPEQLRKVRALVEDCEYTFGCFLSPSGAGLKVFVVVSTEADQHLQAFLSVQHYYEALTGCRIDPSGKDIARLCFISVDESLYCNEGATVFVPDIQTVRKKSAPAKNKPGNISDTYARCIAKAEQKYSFIEGSRHNFVLELALQLRSAGFAEGTALIMLKSDYNYDEDDLNKVVRSVYDYNWTDTQPHSYASSQNSDEIGEPHATAPHDQITEPQVPSTGEWDADMDNYNDQEAGIEDVEAELQKPKRKDRKAKFDLAVVEKLLKKWYITRYNEVTGMIEWRDVKSKMPFLRLIDHDENSMFRRLYHAGEKIPIAILHVLLNSDFSKAFNPFINYFRQLPQWDGVTDYIGQLCNTVKTEDDAYWAFCFRKWFVAYAASLVNDEVINHTVIVLVGIQGSGKTTWMKRLLPPGLKNYLGTAAFQSDTKDTTIQLTECGLIILDEMESLNRKDLASFKEMITRPEIRIRRPYGRNSENLPRHASFVASVNHEQILTDPSGSRRYLCSRVNSIDYNHTIDINKAMAQAIALFESGFKFWFDADEIKVLNKNNEFFISKSVEEELIEAMIQPVSREEWKTRNQFANGHTMQLLTSTQIACKLVERVKLVLSDQTTIKVGKVLKKLGYERIRTKTGFAYMVRFIDSDTIEKNSRNFDDPDAPSESDTPNPQPPDVDGNNQNINSNDDLFNSKNDEGLPF